MIRALTPTGAIGVDGTDYRLPPAFVNQLEQQTVAEAQATVNARIAAQWPAAQLGYDLVVEVLATSPSLRFRAGLVRRA